MAGHSASAYHNGSHIVVAGLLVQALFFACFLTVAILFDLSVHRAPTPASKSLTPWRKHLKTLYFASSLIMIRSIFRVVEYIMGNDGYLLRHEYYLYVFDAVLMWGVMVVFNVVHPSEVNALLKGGRMVKGLKMVEVGGESFERVDGVMTDEV
jgi:RTA1 like protein